MTELRSPHASSLAPSRRTVLRGSVAAGALGAAAAATTGAAIAEETPVTTTEASEGNDLAPAETGLEWLVVDHHVHSLYSHDAKYTMEMIMDKAEEFGVDVIAFTEHSNWGHANEGGVWEANRLIRKARDERKLMVLQGIEWYIPAAEHCTVLVAPGINEARVLRTFELAFDGKLNGWEKPARDSPEEKFQQEKAVEAIAWLGEQKREGFIDDAIVIANHPSRYCIDSPLELRAWHDADRDIYLGMEGAPGAQGSAFGLNRDPKFQRGEYENSRRKDSSPHYPDEAFRTRGGFDYLTSVVGGMWDSLLSEGRRYWITSNSDFHLKTHDTYRVGDYPKGDGWEEGASLGNFNRAGRRPVPVNTNEAQGGSDYWPGQFSRTHVGATSRSYEAVMDAMRAGRIWIEHGHLISGLEVVLFTKDDSAEPVTLGGTLKVKAGTELGLRVSVTPTTKENSAGILPELAHIDLIRGLITGEVEDVNTTTAPHTKVVDRKETAGHGLEEFTVEFDLGAVEENGYIRLRGSDGKRSGVGPMGADVDPAGPIPHGGENGAGSPWIDTWMYTNPIFFEVE